MPSPMPGMDPYLEHPSSWPNFHHRLITAIAISLGPQLRPKYRVVVEEAIYQVEGAASVLVGVPDVAVQQTPPYPRVALPAAIQSESSPSGVLAQPILVELPTPAVVRQGYLEIREVLTSEVVTVIEVLSPANKRPGEGRRSYEAKRRTILASATNLVEIDLLRQWPPMLSLPDSLQTHYRILVSASAHRPQASLYAFNMQDPIPAFSLPLRDTDVEPIVNLQGLLADIYDQSGYDLVIDYREDPVPPLSQKDAQWLATWFQQQGLR
ncbi:MAG: DUF4058 family protein [Coleofasciculus sp. S288]|nr:DUF4058 family protein [Coleofasciculus sp. S288]